MIRKGSGIVKRERRGNPLIKEDIGRRRRRRRSLGKGRRGGFFRGSIIKASWTRVLFDDDCGFFIEGGSVSDDDERKGEESQKITLKEVLDLLGSSEVDGLLALVVLDQGVSTMGQQDLDDLSAPLITGHHQGSSSFSGLEVKITSQTNQTINDRRVTFGTCLHQRGPPVLILVVDVGPMDHQSVHNPEVAVH